MRVALAFMCFFPTPTHQHLTPMAKKSSTMDMAVAAFMHEVRLRNPHEPEARPRIM